MVGESNQNVFLIQIDASSFAEFEISELELSRFDCTYNWDLHLQYFGHQIDRSGQWSMTSHHILTGPITADLTGLVTSNAGHRSGHLDWTNHCRLDWSEHWPPISDGQWSTTGHWSRHIDQTSHGCTWLIRITLKDRSMNYHWSISKTK